MSAKQVLELEIRQTTSGDGVTKVAVELSKAQGGLTDFEKAIAGARSTIGDLDRDMVVFGKNIGSVADAMSAFGVRIPQSPMALFGQLLRKGIDLIWESIQVAGDAHEMIARYQQVFQAEAAESTRILEAYGEEIGRSTTVLQDMAAGIQTILVPMGLGREEAAGWSVKIAQLAVDLGAFYNEADSEVLENLRSGLIGNARATTRYGINLRDAEMNQMLFNMGIEGGTAAATEEEKVLARLNLMMKHTADAQGQAAREAQGFVGQMRNLEAAGYDLQVAIGDLAMPAIMPYIADIADAARGTTVLVEAINDLSGEGNDLWRVLHDLNEIINPVYTIFGLFGDVVSQLGDDRPLPDLIAEFARGNLVMRPFARNIEMVIAGYRDLIALAKTGETGGFVEEVKAEYEALARAGAEVAALNEGMGSYADWSRAAGEATADWTGDLLDATVATENFLAEYEKITSLDANFKGMVRLAEQYDAILGQIGEKQQRIQALMAISETGGYLDGVWMSASKARQEIEDLTGEVGGLQDKMAAMANQVVLDMLMATIAIDGVKKEEAEVYFQMAADMKMISQAAADEAVRAFTEAFDKINSLDLKDKHATYTVTVKTVGGGGLYDPYGLYGGSQTSTTTSSGSSGGGGTGGQVDAFRQEGGDVFPGQRYRIGELGVEEVVFDQPGRVISNRDVQNAAGGAGTTIAFYGPVYMRTEAEIRDVLEQILVDAARG